MVRLIDYGYMLWYPYINRMNTTITLKTIFQHLMRLEDEVHTIKETLVVDPPMRPEFIAHIEQLNNAPSIPIKDFRTHFGVM